MPPPGTTGRYPISSTTRSAKRQRKRIPLTQHPFALGLGQCADDIGERGEVDAAAGLDGFDPEFDGEVALAGAGWPEEVDHLTVLDEVELREREDPVLVERGLEGEVEAGERLEGREPGHAERGLDATVLAQRELFGKQGVDHLERARLAALELTQGVIQDLEGAGHLEPDQRRAASRNAPRRLAAAPAAGRAAHR